jgi:hypothetical protein
LTFARGGAIPLATSPEHNHALANGKAIFGRFGKRTESKADRVRPSLSKTASIVLGENNPNQDPDLSCCNGAFDGGAR